MPRTRSISPRIALSGGLRATLFASAVVLALAGCGDRSLVLKIDVLSFIDPAETEISFGPIPALPGGFPSGEMSLGETEVNLLDNFGNMADVRAVSLHIEVESQSYSGDGTDTLRVYFSDPATDPRATPAVIVQELNFVSGETHTSTADFAADSRVLSLFEGKTMRLAITNATRGPSSGADLSGRMKIKRIDAVVVQGRKAL